MFLKNFCKVIIILDIFYTFLLSCAFLFVYNYVFLSLIFMFLSSLGVLVYSNFEEYFN